MEKTKGKLNVLLIIFVIFGTILASINYLAAVVPINNNEVSNKIMVEDVESIVEFEELDYQLVSSVSNYILGQAVFVESVNKRVFYSAGLIFETDNTLIVIGHGNIDSNGNYFIGDISENIIKKFAESKTTVALLACYSSRVSLNNEEQLVFGGKIDINTALHSLSTILQWKKAFEFEPHLNVNLDFFDPGGSGNGFDPNAAPSTFMNGLKSAHIYNIYWNLNIESAQISLTNYMLGNIGKRIEFTFTSVFYEEQSPGTGVYLLKSHISTFDAWSFIECDMNTYIKINNIKIDCVSKSNSFSVKVDELMEAISLDGQDGFLNTTNTLASIFAGIAGVFMTGYISCKIASTVAGITTLAGLTKLCLIFGIVFGVLAICIIIAGWIISIVWI